MLPLTSWKRYLLALLVLVAIAFILHARTSEEILPAHKQISSFPTQIEIWRAKDIPISPEDLAVLGPGEFLMRDYVSSLQPPVNLYIAYFPSQRSHDTIHSPKNCLPGSGWIPVESGHTSIAGITGSVISINRYVVAKGTDRTLVFYWYQAHGRTTPSEYWAKAYLVEDAIRLNRTDGALIRVMTPITDAGEAAGQTRALGFIQQILPSMDAYFPR
jgi:EpsI family protein